MLFQELGKLKRSSIMASILLAGFGLLMIICPQRYFGALVAMLGYGMLILAAVMALTALVINGVCAIATGRR